jgi:uncharacterized protein YxjI
VSVLNQNVFFVKEHVGLFKAANNFDILNPETRQVVLTCREPRLGLFSKIFRFTDYKRMTPFDIEVATPDGVRVLSVRRGISLFLSKVKVFDAQDRQIGGFSQKLFSIGGAFNVLDAHDQPVCALKGKWTGWDFSFVQGERKLARVTKKWAGLGKELLTTADNYVLEIDPSVPANDPLRPLILAAVLCIDMVLKE